MGQRPGRHTAEGRRGRQTEMERGGGGRRRVNQTRAFEGRAEHSPASRRGQSKRADDRQLCQRGSGPKGGGVLCRGRRRVEQGPAWERVELRRGTAGAVGAGKVVSGAGASRKGQTADNFADEGTGRRGAAWRAGSEVTGKVRRGEQGALATVLVGEQGKRRLSRGPATSEASRGAREERKAAGKASWGGAGDGHYVEGKGAGETKG